MSIKSINDNPVYKQNYINRIKGIEQEYQKTHFDSLIPMFERELRDLGFEFEISSQTLSTMPKYKNVVQDIVVKYYMLAKEQGKTNEQNHFLTFFHFRGFDEVVPMLLEDYCSNKTEDLTRWLISDCLYQIGSSDYIDDYIKIISDSHYGINRQMIILLVGKLKAEKAVPILKELMKDDSVKLQATRAFSNYN